MQSKDLSKLGLGSWQPISPSTESQLLSAIPQTIGVFAIRSSTPLPRQAGTSDIVYIGVGTNAHGLHERLRQCFHPGPTQSTNQNILNLISGSNNYQVAIAACSSVAQAKQMKKNLLNKYRHDHSELPPLNLRS